jgi:glycosyltransferase involved in cell wall biosynthesis
VAPPEVTVIIPTRDRLEHLPRAVESASAQRDVSVEIIVVDDGSEVPVIRPRGTRLIRNDEPRGVAAARNAGARRASAAWLAFLDDDDLWAPEKLETLMRRALAAKAALSYSAVYLKRPRRRLAVLPPPSPERLSASLRVGNAIPGGGSNAVIAQEVFQAANGFDESFSYAADWELWLRLCQFADAVADPAPLTARIEHAENWAIMNPASVHRDLQRLADRYGVSLRRNGPEQQIADALWTRGRRWQAAKNYLRAAGRYADPVSLVRAAGVVVSPAMRDRLRPRDARVASPAWLAS